MRSSENPGMLRLIGGFRLVKGVLLFAAALGAFTLAGRDVGEVMAGLVEQFKIDPGNKYFQALTGKLADLYPKLPLVAVGTFCYGAVFMTEGVGLILAKPWAEWLTVIVTGSFIPIEIYELGKHFTVTKIIVLVLNIAIFIYLIMRLRRERRAPGSKVH